MDHPLGDVNVLDLGQIYQGPYAGMILSYMGADVVKIERPGGETIRDRSEHGETPEVQLLNSNKRGLELDLKSSRGKEVLKDLVKESDVLIENFAVGKMDELGVGYDTLSEVNSELIYAHGSGYGDHGPYSSYPAMDLTVQAISGVMDTTGFPDSPPVKAGPAVTDLLGGIHLVAGILSALYQRETTGRGQYVDVGMFDTVYPTLISPLAAWAKGSDAPPRTGNRHSGLAVAPYNVYEAKDGYLAIICVAERHWESLLEVMERPDLIGDEQFSSKSKRADNIDEVDELVSNWTRNFSRDEAVDVLRTNGVPTARVQSIEEIVRDEHLQQRNMINYTTNKGEGKAELPVPGLPIKYSNIEEPTITSSPRVGEHSAEVLADIAGYSPDVISELSKDNII
jgi:crotonobetainyl-CoA:carnitine CoA-transferase CaiB-like acyl-CoA transferase